MDAKEKTMLAKNGYTLTHVGDEYRIYQDGVKEPLHVIGDKGSGVAVHTFLAYANGDNTTAPADDSEQE